MCIRDSLYLFADLRYLGANRPSRRCHAGEVGLVLLHVVPATEAFRMSPASSLARWTTAFTFADCSLLSPNPHPASDSEHSEHSEHEAEPHDHGSRLTAAEGRSSRQFDRTLTVVVRCAGKAGEGAFALRDP